MAMLVAAALSYLINRGYTAAAFCFKKRFVFGIAVLCFYQGGWPYTPL